MLRILIVEDEDIIRKGLMHTIDWLDMGATIVGEASNGEEGLLAIEKYNPDIVITDIKMPKMSGITMLREAKGKGQFASIILTSFSEFEYAKEAIKLEVVEYLLKPIDEDELKSIILKIKEEIKKKKIYTQVLEKSKNKEQIELVNMDIYIRQKEKQSPYVTKILEELKDNYDKKISIEGIAMELGVSPSYLSRKFKEATGNTFLDFLNKYRIQKAVELLEKGTYKVYEISDLVGFSEYKYFCLVFKKYLKIAPTEFIKKNEHIIQKSKDK